LQGNIQAGITAGSAIVMTDSGFINNGIFLQRLQHIQKQFSQGECVLILVGLFFIPPLFAERVAWKCSSCLLTGHMA
jgi:hypothetical protein